MTIVTANILRPFPSKRAVAEERFKKMASVFERLGATAKTTNFVAGEHTECSIRELTRLGTTPTA